MSNSLVESVSVGGQGVDGPTWLEAGRELTAFVLLQEEGGDQMRPEVLWTGRQQTDRHCGLVRRSGTHEIPNGQFCTSLTGLRFHDYQLKRNIIMTPAVSHSLLGPHTSIRSLLGHLSTDQDSGRGVRRGIRGSVSAFPRSSA